MTFKEALYYSRANQKDPMIRREGWGRSLVYIYISYDGFLVFSDPDILTINDIECIDWEPWTERLGENEETIP